MCVCVCVVVGGECNLDILAAAANRQHSLVPYRCCSHKAVKLLQPHGSTGAAATRQYRCVSHMAVQVLMAYLEDVHAHHDLVQDLKP